MAITSGRESLFLNQYLDGYNRSCCLNSDFFWSLLLQIEYSLAHAFRHNVCRLERLFTSRPWHVIVSMITILMLLLIYGLADATASTFPNAQNIVIKSFHKR